MQAFFPGPISWLVVCAVVVIDVIWLMLSPRLSADVASFRPLVPTAVCTAMSGATLYCLGQLLQARFPEKRRWIPVLSWLNKVVQGLAFILIGFAALRVFNHLTMTLPFDYADIRLAEWDAALGLDWRAYADWVAARPGLIELFGQTYLSLMPTAFFVFAILFLTGRTERSGEFMALLTMTGMVCMAIACLFPAEAAMATLGNPELQSRFGNGAGIYHLEALERLRGEGPVTLSYDRLPGLATFPSFHTCAGVLVIWACRDRWWLFIPAAAYALIMIASTPVLGGHYFVDLVAGTALALAAIGLRGLSYERALSIIGRRYAFGA